MVEQAVDDDVRCDAQSLHTTHCVPTEGRLVVCLNPSVVHGVDALEHCAAQKAHMQNVRL